MRKKVETDDEDDYKIIVKKNIAIEVRRLKSDVMFPPLEYEERDDEDDDWFKAARSSIDLDISSLNGNNYEYMSLSVLLLTYLHIVFIETDSS